MDRRWQLILAGVAAVAGIVALWNVWSWSAAGRTAQPTAPAIALGPDGQPLPVVARDDAVRLGDEVRAPVAEAALAAGLNERGAESVSDACATALPAAIGWGVREHLERSDRLGATLDTAMMQNRVEAFEKSLLRGAGAEVRERWAGAGLRERYEISAEFRAAMGGAQISAVEVDRIEVRPDSLQWDLEDGQAWVQPRSVAHTWDAPAGRTVTVTVPVRLSDGRTGMLGFICAPPKGGDDWVISAGFLIVDSGVTVAIVGL
ncbi:MAG: hypothetical protein DHS20C14_03580 [Phycisphaeraceae bacterium]|nr:MAG: hypothetical protein DHS20C14_03580 [Phycisphaeraceae bacterium]